MYLSGSHVHLYDGMHNPAQDGLNDLRSAKKQSLKDVRSVELHKKLERSLSHSEDNITRKVKSSKTSLETTTSSGSLGYDADTDTDCEFENQKEYPDLMTCDICCLEYATTVCLELPFANKLVDPNDIESKTRKKRERKKSRRLMHEQKIRSALNINDYKDTVHKMEEFSADSERKWTLCYDKWQDQHKLSKIIIGRGQRDEDYPECNSIHLVEAIKDWNITNWRNSFASDLKKINNQINDKYSLLPTNRACLFCVYERNELIKIKVNNHLPLKKDVVIAHPVLVVDVLDEKPSNDVELKSVSSDALGPVNGYQTIPSNGHKDKIFEEINDIKTSGKMLNAIKKWKLTKNFGTNKQSLLIEEEDNEEFEVL